MKILEIVEKASAELCKSSTPDKDLGASNLASCKSQGLRARNTKRQYRIKGKTQNISGKKIRGGKYGGALPVHGKKNKQNAKKGSTGTGGGKRAR